MGQGNHLKGTKNRSCVVQKRFESVIGGQTRYDGQAKSHKPRSTRAPARGSRPATAHKSVFLGSHTPLPPRGDIPRRKCAGHPDASLGGNNRPHYFSGERYRRPSPGDLRAKNRGRASCREGGGGVEGSGEGRVSAGRARVVRISLKGGRTSCGNEPEYIQNALKHVQHADQITCSWTTCDAENAINRPFGPPMRRGAVSCSCV